MNKYLFVFVGVLLLFPFVSFAQVNMSAGGVPRTSPYKTGATTMSFSMTATQADLNPMKNVNHNYFRCYYNEVGYPQASTGAFSATKNYSFNGFGIFTRGYRCEASPINYTYAQSSPAGWYTTGDGSYYRGQTYYNFPSYTETAQSFSPPAFTNTACPYDSQVIARSDFYYTNFLSLVPGFPGPRLTPPETTALTEWASAYCNQFSESNCCNITWVGDTLSVINFGQGEDATPFAQFLQPLVAHAQTLQWWEIGVSVVAYKTTGTSLAPSWSWAEYSAMGSVTAPSATLSANPPTIDSGEQSLLSYACTNSTTASIDQGVGTLAIVSGGSQTVSPTNTTTYTLTCTGSGGTATAQASVTVNQLPACSDGRDNDGDGDEDFPADPGCTNGDENDESGEVRADLSASPTQVPVNSTSILTWECSGGATSASISGIGTVSPASGGSVNTPNLTNASNNFELTCTSPTDTDSAIAVVTTTNPTGTITADPERVLKGTSSTLDWACYDQAVTFSVSGTNGFTAGTKTGTDVSSQAINTQTTFTLFCDSVAVDTAIVNIEVNVDEF